MADVSGGSMHCSAGHAGGVVRSDVKARRCDAQGRDASTAPCNRASHGNPLPSFPSLSSLLPPALGKPITAGRAAVGQHCVRAEVPDRGWCAGRQS